LPTLPLIQQRTINRKSQCRKQGGQRTADTFEVSALPEHNQCVTPYKGYKVKHTTFQSAALQTTSADDKTEVYNDYC